MSVNHAKTHTSSRGFTIVELLIVIVVIAILATISIVAYNGIQTRARETKRVNDMASIEKAIKAYDALHGGAPLTYVYGGNGPGGWNNSTMDNWLTFLEKDFGKMPRDEDNEISGDGYPGDSGERVYFYYCYSSASYVKPNSPTVRIGYRSDEDDAVRSTYILVQSCLTTLPS